MSSLLKRKHVLAATKRSYGSLVVADGASNYWKLDEQSGTTAVDSIGGKNGTISGGVTLNQSGAVGQSMLFNGTTGKIVTAGTIVMSTTVTVEAWIKTTANTRQIIWSNKQVGGVPTSAVQFGVETNIFVQADALGQGTGSISVIDGQWHHVVWVQNGVTVLLYRDGILDYTATAPFSANTLTTSIGFDPAVNLFFNGSIDDVAIYPKALSPAQISSHYALR